MTQFDQIYSEYFEDVYKYSFSLCRNAAIAEDVTQETFFKALKGIDSFKGDCKLRVWLCQIAKNSYFTYCEKEKRHQGRKDDVSSSSAGDLEQNLIQKESAFEIHKLLHELAEPYKEVFTLRMFGELSFMQIGTLFGKTESWARVTFHRAKSKLKENLP